MQFIHITYQNCGLKLILYNIYQIKLWTYLMSIAKVVEDFVVCRFHKILLRLHFSIWFISCIYNKILLPKLLSHHSWDAKVGQNLVSCGFTVSTSVLKQSLTFWLLMTAIIRNAKIRLV